MDKSLYTSSFNLLEEDTSLSDSIKAAVADLAVAFPEQKIQLFKWNENYIAIPLNVNVDLPSRGPVGNVDIRAEEPIILILHRQNFPYRGTAAYSNRIDFPRDQLPHLNPVPYSHPISFCLHRGNFDDWMAEHTILDLVERVRGWLRDAARNRLIPPNDGWEAIRIVDALGITIYSPEVVQSYIQKQWRLTNGKEDFEVLHYRIFPHESPDPLVDGSRYALELLEILEVKKTKKIVEKLTHQNQRHDSEHSTERHLLGLLVWSSIHDVCGEYFANIPDNLPNLLEMGSKLNLPIEHALKIYQRNDYQILNGIPIILAIKRPTKLIGRTSELELLNLVISAKEIGTKDDGIWAECDVFPIFHRTPLVRVKAQEISRVQAIKNNSFLIIGCGAIGSKLVMHLGRSGLCSMTLVDHDELSPHNLVRHALLANSIGMNKAFALGEEIRNLYRENLDIAVIQKNGIDVLRDNQKGLLESHTWLIDTTASSAFLKTLLETNIPTTMRIMRAELAYEGQLGIMSIEGQSRNPRLDDIRVHLYNAARTNPHLSEWLKAELSNVSNELHFEEISIGMGCHTDTMRLADDIISFHSALISVGFVQRLKQASINASLQVSFLNLQNNVTNLQVQIDPVLVFHAENTTDWEIRISRDAQSTMQELLCQASPYETGGILIGQMNLTRKIIYIIEALPPPPDSQSSPYMFVRGISDVWDSVKEIEYQTGGLISYVGEWHSHPKGSGEMSITDKETSKKLYSVLEPAGLPTHIMIATPSKLYAYVFSGEIKL